MIYFFLNVHVVLFEKILTELDLQVFCQKKNDITDYKIDGT